MKQANINLVRAALLVQSLHLLAPAAGAEPPKDAPDLVEAGKAIYEKGILPSGQPLVATLSVGVELKAAQAACQQCHRGSGSGGYEGGNLVPPITAQSLFDPASQNYRQPRRASGMVFQDVHFKTRGAYDSVALARALSTGVTPGGHMMSPLMPRYDFAPADLAALEAYLRTLSATASSGIDGSDVHFATVFTPGADSEDRKAVIEVLQTCFAEKFPGPPNSGQAWRLSVWDLTGEPGQWAAQLQRYQQERPVVAVLSGAANADWGAVHAYCEASATPCLFPNVQVPGSADKGKYNFYFSGGPLLEAAVIEEWIGRLVGLAPRRYVQIVADGNPVALAGSEALRQRVAKKHLPALTRLVDEGDPAAMQRALHDLRKGDILVLWLPRAQLSALLAAAPAPPPAAAIIASGWVGDIDQLAVPEAWRDQLQFVYPFDPPERRDLRMYVNLRPWLAKYSITTRREMTAGNTLAACNLVTETMATIQTRQTPDKLMEAIENYPSNMGNAMATQGYYGFYLGPTQRFSAKGAFIVRFSRPPQSRLEPLSPWLAP